jgi:heat shock protein HtpX
MKRIILFLATNIAVLLALSLITNVLIAFFGVDVAKIIGAEYAHLAIFAVVYGFLGAIISLLLSKPIAKFSCGAVTVDGSEGEAERWLVSTVEELARNANIKTPEVAIYQGSANAFATCAFKNSAIVAVSTDIMSQMTKEELRAVLGHEVSHVANGDMVTLTLIQGVLNAFVLFFSRAAASVLSGGEKRRNNLGTYYLVAIVLQIVLGLFASIIVCAFSRRREYAADSGSAKLLGTPQPMVNALRRLGNLQPGVLPDSLKAFGIAEGRITSIFSTHPSIEKRIEALQKWTGV